MAPGRYCRMKEIGSFTIPSFLHNKAAIRPDLPSPALQCIRMFLSFEFHRTNYQESDVIVLYFLVQTCL